MLSVFDVQWFKDPAQVVVICLVGTAAGIALLLTIILFRRMIRRRFFERRDLRAVWFRRNWDWVVSGEIPPEKWICDRLDCELVEGIALDCMDGASPIERNKIRQFIKNSGLLDRRIREVRDRKSWRCRNALIALGRMRIPEGIPALAEVLTGSNAALVVDAIRALGLIGTPQAAEHVLSRLESGELRCPPQTVQIALVNCYKGNASILLAKVSECSDANRPILARVLSEVATRRTSGDLLPLASDPIAEVRASAARIIAVTRPDYATSALFQLASDEEWFVRLRAVVALGELRDPYTLRALVRALCDPNRLVRLRAATALTRFEGDEGRIFQLTMQTHDRYALQALVSEMERSGRIPSLVGELADPDRQMAVESALLAALQGGAARILIDLWLHQNSRQIRHRLSRLLARSGDQGLLRQLEAIDLAMVPWNQRRLLRWLAANLRSRITTSAPEQVIAV